MKIRTSRLCTLTLISLLSLFAFTAHAGAQDYTFNRLNRPPNVRAKTGNTDNAEIATPDSGHTYSVLYSFCSVANCADGANPAGGLVQDAAGNLDGTTSGGGANGGGTVFKIDSAGNETVMYSFCPGGFPCLDGDVPSSGLIEDASGNLYGTTLLGGGGGRHAGTVFKLDTKGHETVLHEFSCCPRGQGTGGANPAGGLVQDAAGNLYGTTSDGGANGDGTVFKLDTKGHETVLYTFCSASNCTDGTGASGLIQDAAGNLYGTTNGGGANTGANGGEGGGTVFKVDNTGHYTVLYSFCSEGGANCTDGEVPLAGLIQDAAGNLYGTTGFGGANTGANFIEGGGTVFKLEPPTQLGGAWTETVLYNFCSKTNCTDGQQPAASLIRDAAGNLYGTTPDGGANLVSEGGGGTVFKLDTTGHETVLYNFCSASNCTDGDTPSNLIQDAAGNLYGTAEFGGNSSCGSFGCGTVFEIAGATEGGSAIITLTSSPNPSTVDQPVAFSVVVSGSGAMPIGSVTFEQGTTILGTVTLVDGEAGLITTFTKSDKFSIVASYSGDLNYKASKTKPFEQVVEK